MAVTGLAHPQGGRPAIVFYSFGHSTSYALGGVGVVVGVGVRSSGGSKGGVADVAGVAGGRRGTLVVYLGFSDV
jgi:hypothetical protein